MYIINSTGIVKTSAESRKKLALRTVLHNSNSTVNFISPAAHLVLSISQILAFLEKDDGHPMTT